MPMLLMVLGVWLVVGVWLDGCTRPALSSGWS
jgi:hypothetical protein